MTDTWDELWGKKPELVWVPRRYHSKSRIKDDDIQMFITEDMDAWLEKLKAEYDNLQGKHEDVWSELRKQTLRHNELHRILEAVKDWIKTYPESQNIRGTTTRSDLQDWKNHGLRILGETQA